MTRRAQRGALVAGGLVIAAGLAWGLLSWWSRRALAEASRDYAAGRYEAARGRLAALVQIQATFFLFGARFFAGTACWRCSWWSQP